MSNFIELTFIANGRSVMINTDNIASIEQVEEGGTVIQFAGIERFARVRETYQEIKEMMNVDLTKKRTEELQWKEN